MDSSENTRVEQEACAQDKLKKEAIAADKPMYVGSLLKRASDLYPGNKAIVCQQQSITYAQLYALARVMSSILQQRNVQPKDKVVIFFENSVEFYIAYYAVWQVGAVVVPLNTFLTRAEIVHVMDDCKPVCLIACEDKESFFNEILGPSKLPFLIVMTQADMWSVLDSYQYKKIVHTPLEEDDLSVILYTSGTTGVPKGVMLSSKNIITNVMSTIVRLELTWEERILGVLPLFHAFAQVTAVWGAIFIGATVVLVPKIDRRYLLAALEQKPTILIGVPALYGLLCLMRTAPIDDVRYCVSGGDALPDKIRAFFALLYRRKICSGYGLTEASPVVSFTTQDESMPTNTVGYPLSGVECVVQNEDGEVLQQGIIGQLWIKGASIMLGYYNDKPATEAIIKNGWLNTGDLAYIDSRGRIVIAGRVKDLIIHKGLNIYPQEIENILLTDPNVIQAGVVGKEDESCGEIPVAFVQLRVQVPGIEKRLRALCSERLAPYKVPKLFVCDTQILPLTATAKVDKKQLKKRVLAML